MKLLVCSIVLETVQIAMLLSGQFTICKLWFTKSKPKKCIRDGVGRVPAYILPILASIQIS